MANESRAVRLFRDYGSFHKTRGNQLTHAIGIPVITMSLLGLLGAIPIGPAAWQLTPYLRLDGGTLLWGVGMFWYFLLDWRLAIPFLFITLGLNFFARAFPLQVLVALFIIGWALQFFGHFYYEKKSPAFLKNVQHLLVGPFWVCAKMLGYKPQ